MGSTAVEADGAARRVVMEVRRLSCYRGGRPVVGDVSFDVRRGEILALIGPSGSGKTTLLRALNRLHELTPNVRVAGSVLLDGVATGGAAFGEEVLRRRVGYVFQLPNPFPMSIYDNVALPLREHRLVADEAECGRRVQSLLERVGLLAEVGERLDDPALALSGGQQQRLCIARVLAAEPDVVLFDEPCSALDPHATAVIEGLLATLKGELALVIVTHNLAQARRVADRVAFLLDGELVEVGARDQVFGEPRDPRTRDYLDGRFG
jgi:phosphate transport system ATP-binding protein